MKLEDAKRGDSVYYKSYEGVKELGAGNIIDLWMTPKDKKWYATLQALGKKVCVMDSDIRFIIPSHTEEG